MSFFNEINNEPLIDNIIHLSEEETSNNTIKNTGKITKKWRITASFSSQFENY
jgi:hypothetical protein